MGELVLIDWVSHEWMILDECGRGGTGRDDDPRLRIFMNSLFWWEEHSPSGALDVTNSQNDCFGILPQLASKGCVFTESLCYSCSR